MPDMPRCRHDAPFDNYKLGTVMQEIINYAQFYALLKRMPYVGDKEDLKRELVYQGTNGRTESLKEVTKNEYSQILSIMKKACPNDKPWREELRRRRSVCLKLMQKIGVDTTDWSAVNRYSKSKKIAGKEFRYLSCDELNDMSIRLRMILKKQNNQ